MATISEIHKKLLISLRYIHCFATKTLWSHFHSLWLYMLDNNSWSLIEVLLTYSVIGTTQSDWCSIYWSTESVIRDHWVEPVWRSSFRFDNLFESTTRCTHLPLPSTDTQPWMQLSVLLSLTSHHHFFQTLTRWSLLRNYNWEGKSSQDECLFGIICLWVLWILVFLFLNNKKIIRK